MTTLRDGLLGGWGLSSFSSRNVKTGEVSHLLGPRPRGLILYTADGGRFVVDERTATLRHDVTISLLPELLREPQIRQASVDGDHHDQWCSGAQHADLAPQPKARYLMPQDIRELTGDPQAYTAELRRRWGGRLPASVRVPGRHAGCLTVFAHARGEG